MSQKNTGTTNIIFDIGGVLFNYDRTDVYYAIQYPENNPFKPIDQGLNLLRILHKNKLSGNNNYKLYVLSNWGVKSFNLLTKHFPDVFELFDGIVISGNTGWKKPDKRIYHHLIATYSLNAQECVFIDDQIENIEAAETLGITGVFCETHDHVQDKLQKLGLLIK